MKLKCLVILGLFAVVKSASIFPNPNHIPVKVIYGENENRLYYNKLSEDLNGRRNLNEKIQLSPAQLRALEHPEDPEVEYIGNINALKNLNAKIQLSPEQLSQVDKHLPFSNENTEIEGNLKDESGDESNIKNEQNIKPTEINKPEESTFEVMGEEASLSTTVSLPTTEEDLPDPNIVLLIQIAQNIVNSGLTSIRENINNMQPNDESNNPPISAEQWDRLNRTISEFFGDLYNQVTSVKSYNENILQNIADGVRIRTDLFISNLQNPSHEVTEIDQNIITLINDGVQQITKSVSDIPTQSTTVNTILGDPTSSSPNLIQNVVQQVQQFFGNQAPTNPSQIATHQGDAATAAQPPGPGQVFQNVVNQVGQAINNLNPFNQNPNPGSQEDTPPNPIQSAVNQVGQAINNLNPFNQLSTAPPGSASEGSPPNNPFQSFQNAANQVGQAINNIINPTQAPGTQGEGTQEGPVQVFQNVINQVGQAVGNLNPFNQQPPSGSNEESSQQPPFQQAVQTVFNQVGETINNLNPFRPPGSGIQSEGTVSSSSPVDTVQNAINQAGQTVSNLNPIGSSGSNPVEGIQNAINQAGQTVSNLNPLNPSSGASTLVEGAQNAINQAGQTVSNLNPLNPSSGETNPLEGAQNALNQVGQTVSNLNPLKPGSKDPQEEIESDIVDQTGQSLYQESSDSVQSESDSI